MNLMRRNHENTLALLGAALKPTPFRKTGQPGLFRVLPEGWATVTVWPLPGADEHGAECEHWSGPVVADSDKAITLQIGGAITGEPMSWLKSDRITVKYGSGVAA